MKKLLCIVALLATVGCSKDSSVILNDHKDQIDQNSAEIELLKAQDRLHTLQIEDLDLRVTDLEGRMDSVEATLVEKCEDIDELFSLVDGLDSELDDLRSELRDSVAQLRRADRKNRRQLLRKINRLRRSLSSEIRTRRLADNRLQDQIDDLERDLDRSEARQAVINRILFGGLFVTNVRISQLQRQVTVAIRALNSRINGVQAQINQINSEIDQMQQNMQDMQDQIDDVESRLVSVVYPCGEGNSEEVLLQTQDGLVAYFQEMRNQTISFSDTITIDAYTIPAHYHRYGFFGKTKYAGEHTIPAQTYSVGDSATVKVLKKAYLDVLADGSYRTTDGHSCNFTIANGEVQ